MRGTVLVADDQAGARRALANELRDAGFDVCEAENGAQAWERFRGRKPDVVITDMVMPRSDGLDLLGRIREVSEVPVILFTAHGTPQTAGRSLQGRRRRLRLLPGRRDRGPGRPRRERREPHRVG